MHEHTQGLKQVIICDLDGTLCHLNDRSPYDASTCDNDDLNHVVAALIKDKRLYLFLVEKISIENQHFCFLENIILVMKHFICEKQVIIEKIV